MSSNLISGRKPARLRRSHSGMQLNLVERSLDKTEDYWFNPNLTDMLGALTFHMHIVDL